MLVNHSHAGPRLGIGRLSIAGCAPFLALVSGDRFVPLARWRDPHGRPVRGHHDPVEFFHHWPHNAPLLAGAGLGHQSERLSGFAVHAPLQPRQAYCTIGNYRAQVLEAALDAAPPAPASTLAARRQDIMNSLDERCQHGQPYAVLKPASSVADPFASLCVPAEQHTLDWEVELGVVIGRAARHVAVEDALQHVAGYCTVNDITLRQGMFRPDVPGMGTDFLRAKGSPGWLPVGPWFVPASEVPDPAALRLQLRLNGETMQDGFAHDMLFGIAEQIAYLSRHVQLQPGDLVCTGSPAGFGQHHRRFLRPGDRLEAEVIGLGAQCTDLQEPSTT